MAKIPYLEAKSRVYSIVKTIPRGETMTYKQVAEKAGITSPRLVGKILHENKNSDKIPCHRVIRSDGKVANGYAFGGRKEQERKLREEGII